MESEWVVIRIKRPEGYEDVVDELVVEDFVQTVRDAPAGSWEYEIVAGTEQN